MPEGRTAMPLPPLGKDEWRVIDDEDTHVFYKGSEALCKEFMENFHRRFYVLEDPDGTIWELTYDDNEPQWEPIGNRSQVRG